MLILFSVEIGALSMIPEMHQIMLRITSPVIMKYLLFNE